MGRNVPLSVMHRGRLVVSALISCLLPTWMSAQSRPRPIPAAYHSDCHLTNTGESLNVKTKEVVQYYAADCELKYVVGKETRLVWSGKLPLPIDATIDDAIVAISQWILKDRYKLIDADRKEHKGG